MKLLCPKGIFIEVELAKEKGVKPDLEAKRAQRKRKLEKGEEDKAAKRRKVDKKKKKVPSKPKSKALKVAGFQKKSSKLVRRLLKKFGPVDFVLFPSPESTDQKLVGTYFRFLKRIFIAFERKCGTRMIDLH